MVAELMREYGMTVDAVLNGGYFKAHRLWDILNEIKSQNLFEVAVVTSSPHMTDQGREEFFSSLKERQPRRHPRTPLGQMPFDVWEKFKRDFENA